MVPAGGVTPTGEPTPGMNIDGATPASQVSDAEPISLVLRVR